MPTDVHPTVQKLHDEIVSLLIHRAADLDLSEPMIASIRPRDTIEPASLPVLALLPDIARCSDAETKGVVDAIIEAADHLAWRQTYDEEDGFDRGYLDRYGWFDLAGPEGPYEADGIRIMAGYWGQGLRYPDHSHSPEEHYLVLAGSAWFRLGQEDWYRLGPGGVFHTPAGGVHSADMRDEPLLAISIWRAADLSVQINLTDSDRNVVMPGR